MGKISYKTLFEGDNRVSIDIPDTDPNQVRHSYSIQYGSRRIKDKMELY